MVLCVLCHSLSYLYVPGAVARRGSGPMTAAGRRGPRLCAAHGSRAEVVTRQAARSHLVTLRAEPPALRASIIPCTCSLHSCHARVSLLTGRCRPSRPPGPQLALRRRSPTRPVHGPLRAYSGVKTEGIARGFNPLAEFRFISVPRRGPLCRSTLLRGGTAAARRALPKRTAASGWTQYTRALRSHPVRRAVRDIV